MTDQTKETDQSGDDENQGQDELSLLKERARNLGISFSNNIGLESLRQRVNEHLASGEKAKADEEAEDEQKDGKKTSKARPQTKAEAEMELRKKLHDEQMKLVRLRITCMNPHKRDLHGEIFTVANRYLGIVKKFIPYGEATDNGYHVPFVLYQMLKDRKFLQVKTRKSPKNPGQIIVDQRWVPEFALEVLDPLTPAEIKQLAAQQMAAQGLSE